MKLESKAISAKLTPLVAKLRRYAIPLFILFVAMVFGFLIWRIGQLANAEPTDEAVASKLQTVVRPKIDANALKKIDELRAQDINVETLFNKARENPFGE